MDVEAVILAAGLGTWLGRPHPKPLTRLSSGETIIEQQVASLRDVLGERTRITAVVGFKLDLVIEANPDLSFVYNELYDVTDSAKSLLKAFRLSGDAGVLWINDDVVFDRRILHELAPLMEAGTSFVCVDTAFAADHGEAVGINFVSAADKPVVERRLVEVGNQDCCEHALELAIERDALSLLPVDISRYGCIEVKVEDDLDRADSLLDRSMTERFMTERTGTARTGTERTGTGRTGTGRTVTLPTRADRFGLP